MIKKQGNKFVVTNKAGTKVLGTHSSKQKAAKQLAAIEISKAKHMHENKSFKAFRSALNESEYSEVLTGYGNRSAHKDGAGLHHLQSAGALAGINAMLATIGKSTYLDPNEAFLKIKVRLNVVQLDFPWTPRSWDGGVGSFDIPVVQFGRVDGYDAQTGEIRFDGKANPTGGYTELNLHVDVELTPESLYVVTAKLTPSVPVTEDVDVTEAKKDSGLMTDIHNPKGKAVVNKGGKVLKYYRKERSAIKHATTGKAVKEEIEIDEDHQTDARHAEMRRKIEKQDDIADRAYTTKMNSPSEKVATRAHKRLNRAERRVNALIARDEKEYHSPRTYGRGGKLIKRGSRREVKEEIEQIDELSKGTKDAYVAKRGSQLSSMLSGHKRSKQLTGPQQANAVKGIKRAMGVKEENEVSEEWKSLKKTKADLNAIRASGKKVSVQHGEGDTLYRVSKAKKSVKEDVQTAERKTEMKAKIAAASKKEDRAGNRAAKADDRKEVGPHTLDYGSEKYQKIAASHRAAQDARAKLISQDAKEKNDETKLYGKGGKVVAKRKWSPVKEEIEQIDEAGQAKLERLGKAYDKARIGSRGVLNPENKKRLGDAYFKMRDKVLDKRKKRIESGTFDKEAEVKAVVAKNTGTFSKVFGKKTVKEELVGGQKKLDLNKNKRLDSQDFALLRAKKKKPMAEAKMKQWTPRLDRLVDNRDAVRSKPKKTILTQKVQDGKKVGSARPIRKYEE